MEIGNLIVYFSRGGLPGFPGTTSVFRMMMVHRNLIIALIGGCALFSTPTYVRAQGWVAHILVDVNHRDYGRETLTSASVTYSGFSGSIGLQTGSSGTVVVFGTGVPNGVLSVAAAGIATLPFNPAMNPPSTSFTASFSGTVSVSSCSPVGYAQTPAGITDVDGSVTVYPQALISSSEVIRGCDFVTLKTSTCWNGSFLWEVSDNLFGPWSILPGGNSTATFSGAQISTAGISSPYGSKYFRVTGITGTTSPVESVEISAPGPTLSFSKSDPLCHNQANGEIRLTIKGAIPEISNFVVSLYEGSPPNPVGLPIADQVLDGTTITLTGLSGGKYWARVENNSAVPFGNCWTDIDTLELANPAPVTVQSFTRSDFNGFQVRCNGGSDGFATVNPQGGTGIFSNFVWSNGATQQTAAALGPNTYSVTFTDSNGCVGNGNVQVTEPSAIALNTVGVSEPVSGFQVSCAGKNDGEINVNASGGVPTYTYQWTNGPNTPVYAGLAGGTYMVQVTDANNCTAQRGYTLVAKPKTDFQLDVVENICAGGDDGSVAVNLGSFTHLAGTARFLWSQNSEVTSSIERLLSGTYQVTVTDDRGPLCSVQKSATLVDPPAYSATITAPTPFNGQAISCHGASDGQLIASLRDGNGVPATGQNYAWLRNGLLLTSGTSLSTINALTAGNYKVVITYNSVCQTEKTFTLNDPTPVVPVATITSDYNGLALRCTGNRDGALSVSASGGTAPYTFSWNDPLSTIGATLSNVGAGAYLATARDANGCAAVTSKTLVDPTPVTPAIQVISNFNGFAIRCAGDSNAQLRAGASGGTGTLLGYAFTWNTGQTGADLTGQPAGSYSVIATDQNGCTGTASRVITQPTQVQAAIEAASNFNGQAISCAGASNGSLLASGSGGAGGFTFVWGGGATSALASGLSQGSYTVTATDLNGCPATATRTITAPEPVVASFIETSDYRGFGISCAGRTDGYLKAGSTGGTGLRSYEWVGTTESSDFLTNVPAGTYTVRVRDANGCVDTKTKTLTQPEALMLSLVSASGITCHGGADGKIELSANGGVPAYEFSRDGLTWQTSNLFTSLRAQTYTLYLRDANACTTTQSNTLTQPPPILISFTDIEPAYCADPRGKARAIVSGGVGGFTYEWRTSTNLIFDQDLLIENLSPGIYTLNVTDANLCPASAPVGITSADGPVIEVGEKVEPKCSYSADGRILITATGNGPFEYRWSNGQQTAILQNVEQGTYISSVRDVNGCLTTKTIELNAPEPLAIKLVEATNPACFGDANGTITVEASGGKSGYAYQWASTSGAQATSLPKGTHLVTVTDSNNCVAQSSFSLSEPDVLRISLIERILPLCFGGCNGSLAVDATGGNGDYQFLWNNETKTKKASQLCSGNFSVSVVDKKGCQTTQSYSLGQPAPLQIRVLENRAPDCFDGCNGRLQVDAIGGTGNTQWLWNSGATNPERTGLCAGTYGVTVTDVNGCQTSSSYTIANPEKLMIDLGEGVTLCVGQTYVLDAGAQWASYAWTSNTGLTSNQQRVVIQNAGRYQVVVKNALGCEASDEFLLETSRDLLKASFLLPAEAAVQDTVAFIDVSWPLPERAQWTFPAEMRKVIDLGDVVFGRFEKSGTYSISLLATLGECRDVLAKNIRIVPASGKVAGGRLGYQETVKAFELYPNPSAGNFQVLIELSQKEPVTLSVWNPVVGRTVAIHRADGDWVHHLSFELDHLGPGTYVLRLDYPQGSQYRRFVITK